MRNLNLITYEGQFDDLAADLLDILPLGQMEQEDLDTSVQIQLDMLASRALGMAHGMLTYAEGKVLDAQSRLTRELEHYDGSEVKDVRLQRATNWYGLMQGQLEFIEGHVASHDELKAAKAAYKEYFGRPWVPYSETKNVAAKMKDTAAAAAAREALGIK